MIELRPHFLGAALCFAFSNTMLLAQDVTLTSRDGSSKIIGELIGFDNLNYQIRTSFGEVSAEVDLFDCSGEACPQVSRIDQDLAIASNYDRVGDLSFALLSTVTQKEKAALTSFMAGNAGRFELVGQVAEVTVSIDHMSSSDAFATLISGNADLAIVNRLPTPDEQSHGLVATVLAEEGAAIVVGDRVNLRSLSLPELAKIFSGEVTDWNNFGLPSNTIQLFGTNNTEASHEVFLDRVMGGESLADTVTLFATSEEVVAALTDAPYGIGIVNFSEAKPESTLALEDQCGRLSSPSEFSIKMGEYPLTSRIYGFTTQTDNSKLSKSFLAQPASPEGQAFLSVFDLIGSELTSYSIDQQGRRLMQTLLPSEVQVLPREEQRFLSVVRFADRLSMKLPYDDTGKLTGASEHDLQVLAEKLKSGQFDGKEVMFVAFTGSDGLPDVNLSESIQVASEVLAKFETMIPAERYRDFRVASFGFGELSPLYCNTEAGGHEANRRIEVWVR